VNPSDHASAGAERDPASAERDPARGERDPARGERDYVLGTHDAEITRLGFQHSVWRDEVHQAWRTAGIGPGASVLDVGAGPGFASLDLAELVGSGGRVVAVERSRRFLDLLTAEAAARGLANITATELDLMVDPLPLPHPATGYDAAWCRWVACFVPDPALLVRKIAGALRPGGRAVFHEYSDYGTYGLLPRDPAVAGFVEAVFESWRMLGGEPNIARVLPHTLAEHGLALEHVRPIARAARPTDRLWNWPAGFARTNVPRLVELGIRSAEWGREVLDAIESAERDAAAVFITPTVLEIVAVKR
jgi:SAM-dependent methyltransferase